MATKLAAATANALANAVTTAADAGAAAKIIIYAGTEAATADTVLSIPVTNQILATFTLSDPSFGAASGGVITLASPPKTVAASASGTASFFRLLTSADAVVLQGTVGTSGAQLNLNTLAITSGVNVTITSGTITMPTS